MFYLERRKQRTKEVEEQLFQPFMMIKPLNIFVIRVSWDSLGFDDANTRFRVARP